MPDGAALGALGFDAEQLAQLDVGQEPGVPRYVLCHVPATCSRTVPGDGRGDGTKVVKGSVTGVASRFEITESNNGGRRAAVAVAPLFRLRLRGD